MQRPARNEIPQLKLSAKTPTYSPLKKNPSPRHRTHEPFGITRTCCRV